MADTTQDHEHGTTAGVSAHKRAGTKMCLPCLDAEKDYKQAHRIETGESKSIRVPIEALRELLAGANPTDVLSRVVGPKTLDTLRTTNTLFDVEPTAMPVPTVEPTSGEVRRRRQLACAQHGQHPLVAALRIPIRLHPNAAPADDRTAPGLRCGTCVHRVVPNREVAGRYPKCDFDGGKRATAGPGTDCAAWFPACVNYKRGTVPRG